jgi:hypothetical protein
MDDRPWHPLDGVPPPEVVPDRWDAGHVAYRMTKAFEVLRSTPHRDGPLGPASCWPAALREIADYASDDAWVPALAAAFSHDRDTWTADDFSKMEEALAWPMQHLRDQPPQIADALCVWAMAKGYKLSLRAALRHRAEAAKAKAADMQARENLRRTKERMRLAKQLAAETSAVLAHERVEPGTERARQIRDTATAEFKAACAGLEAVMYLPHEVVPHLILSRATLDKWLPRALNLLAERLQAAGVPLR